MTQFHTDEYVDFLSRVSPDNVDQYVREQSKCACWGVKALERGKRVGRAMLMHVLATFAVNVGDDCPVFDGLFEYCSIAAGGSMGSYPERRMVSLMKMPLTH